MKELKITLTMRGETIDLANVSDAMQSVSTKLELVKLGDSTQFNFSDEVESVLINVSLVNIPNTNTSTLTPNSVAK